MSDTKKDLIFNIGEKVVKFSVGEFNDLDIDTILKIDYTNLIAEMITFPVVVNRIGLLAADMDNELQQVKLDLLIYEAKRKNELRDNLSSSDDKGKVKNPTIDEVNSALYLDKIWKVKKTKLNRIEKEKEYMYSIYTSAKDKSNKLDKLSLTIKSGDVDHTMIQKQLNSVYFKIKDGLIK